MTMAIDILDEVKNVLILRNEDIIKIAFNLIKSRFYCDCSWSRNRSEFFSLLKHYIDAKCSMSKRKRAEKDYGASISVELKKRIVTLRQKLSLIWPCDSCFIKFNPTGRKRQ